MGVDISIHHYSEPPSSQEQLRATLCEIDSLQGYIANGGTINPQFVGAFESIKDTLFGLTGADLITVARNVGITDATSNKGVINAFTGSVFPELGTRSVEQHGEYLGDIQDRLLGHFGSRGVNAVSTGSYALRGEPSTQFSDLDILVSPAQGGEMGFLDAINSLPELGIYGFTGDENGALGGANMVAERGNAGYGLIRALTSEGCTIEFLIIGNNSLAEVAQVGGRVPRWQQTKRPEFSVRSFRAPHDPTRVRLLDADHNFICWPEIQDSDGSVHHGLGFLENLVLAADTQTEAAVDTSIQTARQNAFRTAASLMERHNSPSLNGRSGEGFLEVLSYAGPPRLAERRRSEMLQHFETAQQDCAL